MLRFLHGPQPKSLRGGGWQKGGIKGRANVEAGFRWRQWKLIFGLAALAGLRSSEVIGFELDDANLETGWLRVDRQLNRGKIRPPKYNSRRKVPIDPILKQILIGFMEGEGRESGPAFCFPGGRRRAGENWIFHQIRDMQELRAKEAKEESDSAYKFSTHCWRHFAGSAWLHQGCQIHDVSWWLGHKDISFTKKIYAHQLEGDNYSRRMLDTIVSRFPGIPHSIKALPAPEEPEAVQQTVQQIDLKPLKIKAS